MAFHPLTPGEAPPEPFRPQAWHGIAVVGALIVAIPGIVLLARRDPPTPAAWPEDGAYAEVGDTALGGGVSDGMVSLDSSQVPSLAVYTIPMGVAVTIDGAPAGVTPFRSSDLQRRAYRVLLSADGYVPVDTVVHLESNPRSLLAVDLVPIAGRPLPPAPVLPGTPPVPVATALPAPMAAPSAAPVAAPPAAPAPVNDEPGEVTVAVVPWGSIYVDGQLVARETDVRQTYSLAPGTHRVAAEHPTLGRREVTVQVQSGRTRNVSIEFRP